MTISVPKGEKPVRVECKSLELASPGFIYVQTYGATRNKPYITQLKTGVVATGLSTVKLSVLMMSPSDQVDCSWNNDVATLG